jgi:hypothetical protein
MFLLSLQESKEGTDGDICKAVWQPSGPGIPLFRSSLISGHLPLLTRPENIVHFFRDIHQVKTIDTEVLRQHTDDYHRWGWKALRKNGRSLRGAARHTNFREGGVAKGLTESAAFAGVANRN